MLSEADLAFSWNSSCGKFQINDLLLLTGASQGSRGSQQDRQLYPGELQASHGLHPQIREQALNLYNLSDSVPCLSAYWAMTAVQYSVTLKTIAHRGCVINFAQLIHNGCLSDTASCILPPLALPLKTCCNIVDSLVTPAN